MTRFPDAPVTVRGHDLELLPFLEHDVDDLLEAFSDADVAAWNPGPASPDDVRTWLRNRNDWSSGEHCSWAVRGPGGRLLGSLSLHHLDGDQADAEIGYWVAPWARRRGIAAAAVRLGCRFAFGDLGLHRVYLYHAVENVGSCGVAMGAGFRLEGELRQSHRYADGRYHDEHLHARLSDE